MFFSTFAGDEVVVCVTGFCSLEHTTVASKLELPASAGVELRGMSVAIESGGLSRGRSSVS